MKTLLASLTLLAPGALWAQQRPNIILIMTDDQGYGDFRCTGNPYVRTPNMDRFRQNGMMFSNFHVSAVSAPTRAALMTGRYAYRGGVMGVNQSRVNLFADEVTIAEYLKQAGYKTALFGKWHLGYNYPMRPIDQGFDEYYTWNEMQFLRTDPVMEENGCNVQYRGEFLTDVIFGKAIGYLDENRHSDNPFFIYLATYLPHAHADGRQVPAEYVEPYDQYADLVTHTREVYSMISKVDEQLGLLLDKLRETGLDENTLIIFGTDNGPARCFPGQNRSCQERYNAGLRGMKGSLYEGGIRTPWFFVWKDRIEPGSEQTRFTAHVDILPTLLDITGAAPDASHPLDGHSVLPLLLGGTLASIPETRYYYQYPRRGADSILADKWPDACYIEGGYKLVEGRELYNIALDRTESDNLAASDPNQLAYMRERCSEFFGEQVAERNLAYQPNIIGAPQQDVVGLTYFEIVPREKGWPVEIVGRHRYELTIHDIQTGDIAEGARFVVEASGKHWEQPVDRTRNSLTFGDLDLPRGAYFLRVFIEGDNFPRKFKTWTPAQGRYHATEYGHRLVTVRNLDGKTGQTLANTAGLYDSLWD